MRENFEAMSAERKLLVFTVLVAGFATFGPFGTYESLTFWSRLVFWSVIIAAVGFLMHVGISFALIAPSLSRFKRALRIGIGVMVGAVPSVGVVIFGYRVMVGPGLGADAFPFLWAQVASISWLAAMFEYREPPAAGEATPPAPVRTRFHKRLPDGEDHDIISLSMSDHYAEVTTTRGTHLVLIRMADAIAELDGLPGFRIHRSHWIARAHLKEVVTRSKKSFAMLSDGRQLPVSKTYLDAIAAAAD